MVWPAPGVRFALDILCPVTACSRSRRAMKRSGTSSGRRASRACRTCSRWCRRPRSERCARSRRRTSRRSATRRWSVCCTPQTPAVARSASSRPVSGQGALALRFRGSTKESLVRFYVYFSLRRLPGVLPDYSLGHT